MYALAWLWGGNCTNCASQALFTSQIRPESHLHSILPSTRGIIFLGTPHHGASLAKWADFICRSISLVKQTNSEILNVLKRDSEVLARIQDGFLTMVRSVGPPPIEVTCFYEMLPVLGVGLVSHVKSGPYLRNADVSNNRLCHKIRLFCRVMAILESAVIIWI